MMVDCWHSCPDRRPSFRNIATKLGNILENSEDYLEMNTSDVDKHVGIVSNDVYGEYENSVKEKDPLMSGREHLR